MFLCFFENLLVHIPTALRVAKAELHFQKNIVIKSITLLKKLKQYTPPERYFKILFKLSMMKIQCQLDEEIPNRDFFDTTFTDLEETFSLSEEKLEKPWEISQLMAQ